MILRVGQPALRGDVARYARHFDLLELRAEPGKMPRAARLSEWRERVPETFVFSVLMPRTVCALEETAEATDALARALRAADALHARWLVLQTPPSVTPSTRNKKRIAATIEALLGKYPVAWEPRGMWEDDDAEALAQVMGATLVRDIARSDAPDAPVVYTRLRGLGDGGTVRTGAIEHAAELLEGRDEAYVLIEGSGAVRAARLLRQLLGASDAGDLDDDDDDDEVEDADADELGDEAEEDSGE